MTSVPARKDSRRPTHNLSPNVDRRLASYATAATAAGIGVLALAQPADAKIVYTPSDIPITANAPAIQLDLNHDGIADFSFYNAANSEDVRGQTRGQARPPLGFYQHSLAVYGARTGNSVGAITSFTKGSCAAELEPGRKVGPGKNFKSGRLPLFAVAGDYTSPGTLNCPWQGNRGGFLGLKFVVNGETYYGWAHVTLGATPTITGYAFEDTPNTAIQTGATKGPDERSDAERPSSVPAPTPATLGHLANGALGLVAWRKHEDMD